MLERRSLVRAMAAASLVAPAAFSKARAETGPPGTIISETRTLTTSDGERVAYELGTLFVKENRLRPGSRVIGVGFARFKSTGPAGGPPTVHLPGGPGSSYVAWLADNKPIAIERVTRMHLPFRAAGDVILIDQRGFSSRGEQLTYLERPVAASLDRPASIEEEVQAQVAAIRLGLAAYPEKDLSGYTILDCADDVDDLRRALGYGSIALVGQSFGSQWSLAVMRRHPDIVCRAVLSGVEPLNNHYDMPSHIFASLQRMANEASVDPRLAPWMPPGGLMPAVRAVRDRLARAPVRTDVVDTASGRKTSVVVGLGDFQQALLCPTVDWPALILSLHLGHYEGLGALALGARGRSAHADALIGPLIDTSIGVTPARRALLRSDPAVEFLGGWNFEGYLAATPYMPTRDVGDDFRTPVRNETPVLFMHGDWDTSTPIENSEALAPYFPNSHLLHIHRGGHIARLELSQRKDPVMDQVVAFARTGRLEGLPDEVSLPAPTFALPPFAPPRTRQG